jgi:hypothetical protein
VFSGSALVEPTVLFLVLILGVLICLGAALVVVAFGLSRPVVVAGAILFLCGNAGLVVLVHDLGVAHAACKADPGACFRR